MCSADEVYSCKDVTEYLNKNGVECYHQLVADWLSKETTVGSFKISGNFRYYGSIKAISNLKKHLGVTQ